MKVRKKNGLRAGVLLLCLCFLFSALAVPTFADEVSTAPSEAPGTSTAPSEAPEKSTVSSEVPETSSAPSEMPESTESKNSIVDSGTCGENVTWTLDENGVLTISGTGEMENFGNGGSAPWDELSVLQVNIEDGITVIGSDAFAGCSNLQKVSIPNSVQQINFRAFSGCKSLTSIEIPDSVTTVGGWAFESCGLSSVTLSSNLTSISWGMFASCKELTEIVIPDHITSIETAAFEWCNNLVEVKISENVTSIGEYAFAETGITSVVIPDSVQKIGDKAFSKCDELKDIKFEGNSPEFSANSFEGIVGKASYPLGNTTWTEEVMQDYGGTITWVAYDPDSGESIVDSGTCGENLTWTLDENGVLTISGTGEMENYAYDAPWGGEWEGDDRAARITTVKIESGVTTIGTNAFGGCTNLQTVEIPDGVKSIAQHAFTGCKSLREIEIPDSVTVISGAFPYSGLEKIKLSSNLKSIGQFTFLGCTSLKHVDIPNTVTEIRFQAFQSSGLTEITIPDSVQYIYDEAFSYCANLKEVRFLGNAPKFIDKNGNEETNDAFENDTLTIYYPAGNATWTKEVMQDYGGTITWVAYDPDSGATSAPEPTEKPAEDLSYMLKIEGEDGIRITEGLKAAGVETTEQVKEKLLACVLQNEGYTAENTDLFEVTLRVSKDDGYTWGDVSADSFPESGEVRVTLPYPKGAPKDTPKENYKVYHMFTQDVNGHKAGEIEACPVEKIDEGLVVTLHGLSPVMVAWKPVDEAAEPTAAPSTEPTSAPSAEPTAQPKPTAAPSAEPTAAPTEQPAGDAPKTGDNGVHVLWIAAVLLSGGAMTALVWAKRKKQ